MSNARTNRKKNLSVYRSLESLEDRRLLTTAPASWSYILSDSNYAQYGHTSADPGDSVPTSGPENNYYYSIRALVTYFNTTYNGNSTASGLSSQPFTIQLGNDTYTLSQTTSTSNLWGGRLENSNQYGDLDISPTIASAPLIIQGVAGGSTVITCSSGMASSGISFGLDRLIQVESGSLQLQNLTLKSGQALDNGGANHKTSGLGGAVLVNPGGVLSLTNCVVSANSAGPATNYSYASGLNAAGGGLYGSPGSTININGNTSFIGNDVKAGMGGTSGSTGMAGGNAYGAGIAIDAPVPDNTINTDYPTTTLSFNAQSGQNASFLNNRLNSLVTYEGKVLSSGGTGGAGTGTGGAGGNAYGAGLYIGSGQLNINGGSTNSPITFTGNQARGGLGASTSTDVAGANGTAYGAGVYFMPSQVSPVANSPSSGGIMQFSNNTAGGATSGLYIPTVSASVADSPISANSPWNLRTAVAATTALSNTGMSIGLNLGSGDFTLNQGTGLSIQGNEGSGASASTSISGKVTGLNLTNGGSGYQSAPSVTLSSPVSGTTAQATATVSGSVSSLNLTNAGSGYTSAPSVTFSGGGGSGASGTVNLSPASGGVSHLSLTNTGSVQWMKSPGNLTTSITISGGGGTGATGYGTIIYIYTINFSTNMWEYEARLTSLVLTNGGSGYTSLPTVAVDWPNASAYASVSFTTPAEIKGITLTNAGSGYTSAPTVTLTGDGGSGATATATINLRVNGLTLTNAGSGYTSAPTVTFSGGGESGASAIASESNSLSGITLTSGGSNYYTNPTVIISGGGGSGATASASVSNGVVSSVSITNAGSGYTSAPSVIFQMAPSNPITIIGAGKSASKIIGGTSANSIFNIANKNVVLSNLTLTGANVTGAHGGAISASNAAVTLNSVSVTKNSVSNNSGSGGGIYQNGGSLTLNNSIISHNNVANGSGGGIFSIDGVLESNNSSISYNEATGYWGGGIYANSTHVTLANTTMVYNSVVNQPGGAIYQSAGSQTIQNSNISYNNASTGGGIYVIKGCDLNISGGSISNNTATGNGGGLAVTSDAIASLSAVIFSGNTANNGYGGGIYQKGGTVNIKSSSNFKNNSASQGGAAYLANGTTTMKSGVVENNNAVYYGGGLLSYNNNLNVTSVSIKTNTLSSGGSPSGFGGGLSQTGSGTLNLKNSVVKNNSAAEGGGLFFSTSTLNVINSTFKLNTATSVGAGIYAPTNTKAMNLTSANISSNTISGSGASSGAGIYVSGGTLNTKGFNLNNNNITATSNATIEGAGIYANGTSINFNGGTSFTTTISRNQLVGSGGGTAYGAGISAQSGTSVTAQSNITFSNNTITGTANGVGGAIAFFTNTSYTYDYSITCSGNSANAGGNDYAFELAYYSDNNNSSSQNGPGGISYFTNTSGSPTLRNAIEFCQTWMNGNSNNNSMAIMLSSTSNYTLNNGSGQLSTSVPSGDSLTIIGTNGNATIQGWNARTLYVRGSGTLVLQNIKITGGNILNTGGSGGGIYLDSGTLTLNSSTVTGNYAGYTGQAAAGANSAGTANGHKANGGNGSPGASGYGGGIYMAGGTLNLLSSSVTGNFVNGQMGGNGGNGQNGTASADAYSCGCHDTQRSNGGNGGYGGEGGGAFGGGIYQAGGTLNSPSESNYLSGNYATPGSGGYSGAGGAGGSWSETKCGYTYKRTSSAGYSPTPNYSGSASTNYDQAGGQYVFSSNSNASAQSQSIGGLYQSASSINQAALRSASVPKRLPGVIIELYSDDNKLIATATTDQNGRYRFNTNYSGIGYLYVEPLKTFVVSEKGSQFSGGVTSAFDPASGKTDPVQLIDGVVVNTNLNLVLSKIDSGLIVKGNSIRLNRKGTHSALWQTQLMPKSYHGGFTLSTFDVNNDTTPDYVLITKTGKPMAFIVDARTGQSTKLGGQVASNLRNGFVVQTANLQGDSTKELILAPSRERSGRISVIDLQAKKVLWNATDFVLGGMKINQVGADPSGHSEYSSFQLVSLRQNDTFKILDGATGKLLETVSDRTRRAEERQAMKAEKMQSASIASVPNATQPTGLAKVSIPRRRLPVMN